MEDVPRTEDRSLDRPFLSSSRAAGIRTQMETFVSEHQPADPKDVRASISTTGDDLSRFVDRERDGRR
ncbi:hypothetical protein [Halovivax gelatinilyticus]|uniref:hypothetical protein n=1 Tax=Halovivax gelatinilyticus TaxID=2961597 RepID=UPI0020CA5B42|nr:hypothetical protein [Halovivax gelatinilyticus]